MLEMLLREYENAFGKPFPLPDFEGHPEIDVINLVYACLEEGHPYVPGMKVKNQFPDAPRS